MSDLTELANRYNAVWNEPDADRRRQTIAALWAADATHYTQNLEARGYDAIEARVAGAYEWFVRAGGFNFTTVNDVVGHHNVARLKWEMAPAVGGDVAAAGWVFLVLDDDGRIRADYQFTDPPPA